MNILVVVDKFSGKKGLADKISVDATKPIVPQIYKFLCGNEYDEKFFHNLEAKL